MRIALSIVVGGLLMAASPAVEAGWLGFGSKLPKPIDVMSISRPWDPGQAHASLRPGKYNKVGWGARWKLLSRTSGNHLHPYVRGY